MPSPMAQRTAARNGHGMAVKIDDDDDEGCYRAAARGSARWQKSQEILQELNEKTVRLDNFGDIWQKSPKRRMQS